MGRILQGIIASSCSKGILGLSTTYATAEINEAARAILDKFGIGINSVANGVYLSNHKGRHSIGYSKKLYEELGKAKTREEVLRTLNRYRIGLLKGDIPL